MQILLFTALGFFLLLKHLAGEPTISLDTDWFYRKGGRVVMKGIMTLPVISSKIERFFGRITSAIKWFAKNPVQASFLLSATAFYKIFGVVPGIPREYSDVFLNEIWKNYPGEPVMRSPVGDGIILVMSTLIIYGLFQLFSI
jgi:multicomponent Na+:H+ antiporter subunit D